VRDLEVSPVEAIAYLRWLRARAGAHDVTKFGYLLSVDDVANAQSLARRLIMDILQRRTPNKSPEAMPGQRPPAAPSPSSGAPQL
jgi:hypothetical protein